MVESNHTWELVEKPTDQKIVGCKWKFKKKDGDLKLKTTFLHGGLEERIYMQQSEAFDVPGK